MDNRHLISEMISQSSNEKILSEIFSDHFNNIDSPVSVSLGLSLKNNDIADIVNILRENGINAIPFYSSKVKDDMNSFVVDGTGIRSPILSSDDAIKATADLFEIMEKHNIKTSRAMPVSKENLIPAITRTYENKIIDINKNNPQQTDISKFISQQLETALSQPSVIFASNTNSLYRGGTLGDNPYAITPHNRKRDGVYASNDVRTSIEYSDGKKGNGYSFNEIEIENKGKMAYGFLYEFELSKGQRFYGMAEIESPYGSEECKGHPDNRPDYETLIIPERNPVKAIYLTTKDKVVQIADKNGYFSEDWKKFAKIHTPYDTNEKNDFMVERINKQIADFKPVEYQRKLYPLEKDTSELQFDGLIFGKDITKNQDGKYEINNANISSMIPKNLNNVMFKGGFNLSNCTLSQETNILDLHNCTGIVGISDCDMSAIKEIKAPNSCNLFFLENVKLREGTTLDLSQMKSAAIVFSDQDFSKIKELKLPSGANIKCKGNTILPPNTTYKNTNHLSEKQPTSKDRINELRGLSTLTRVPRTSQKTNINQQIIKAYKSNSYN